MAASLSEVRGASAVCSRKKALLLMPCNGESIDKKSLGKLRWGRGTNQQNLGIRTIRPSCFPFPPFFAQKGSAWLANPLRPIPEFQVKLFCTLLFPIMRRGIGKCWHLFSWFYYPFWAHSSWDQWVLLVGLDFCQSQNRLQWRAKIGSALHTELGEICVWNTTHFPWPCSPLLLLSISGKHPWVRQNVWGGRCSLHLPISSVGHVPTRLLCDGTFGDSAGHLAHRCSDMLAGGYYYTEKEWLPHFPLFHLKFNYTSLSLKTNFKRLVNQMIVHMSFPH